MISYSYFASWAGALVDSNSTSVGLLPACVISFLVPEGLKGFIGAILLLSSLWLGCCLLGIIVVWSVVMNVVVRGVMVGRGMMWCIVVWGIMVDWGVVVDVVMDVVVDITYMFSIDNMVLSVLCLEGLMDSLWVDVMVVDVRCGAVMIVVVDIVVFISEAVVVGAFVTIAEWVIVYWVFISETMAISVMWSVKSIVPCSVVAGIVAVVLVECTVVSVTSKVSIAEISVVSVMSIGLNRVSVSWNVSLVVIMKVV